VLLLLQTNVEANSLLNITAYKMAVTDHGGDLIEMDPPDANTNAQGQMNLGNAGIGSGGDSALTVCIDDMNLPKIDFARLIFRS